MNNSGFFDEIKFKSKDKFTSKNWYRLLITSVLMSIVLELTSLVIWPHRPDYPDIYWGYSYDWIWEFSALLTLGFLLYKFKVNILLFVLISVFGSFVSSKISNYIPDNLKIQGNYYGVAIENSSIGDQRLNGGLFCSQAKMESSDIIEFARNNKYVLLKRKFLFWQTGVGYGYYPDFDIMVFNWPVNLLNKFLLFLIVGPVLILEVLIKEIASNFLIIVFLQWVLYKKFGKNTLVVKITEKSFYSV